MGEKGGRVGLLASVLGGKKMLLWKTAPKGIGWMLWAFFVENFRYSESKRHHFDPNLQIHQSETLRTYII